MRAAVRLLFEDGGRPLPLHRLAMPPKLHIGQFAYGESHFKEFRRMVYCATLEVEGQDRLVLYDAVLRYVGNGDLTFSGLELDVVARKFTAMSWRVQFIPDEIAPVAAA